MLELKVETLIRPYESVVIVHPDATEEDQKALFKKNKAIIESFKGEITNLDTWGKRKLGNPINKVPRAIYFHTIFKAVPEAITELERTMRINDKVLRFMHSRLDDGTDLSKFLEDFRKSIQEVAEREREREAKFQAKRAARSREGGGGGGGRGFDRDGGGGGGRGFDREGGGGRGDREGGGRPGGDRDGGNKNPSEFN